MLIAVIMAGLKNVLFYTCTRILLLRALLYFIWYSTVHIEPALYLNFFVSRELAFQISEQFEALGANIGVKCGEPFNYIYIKLPAHVN